MQKTETQVSVFSFSTFILQLFMLIYKLVIWVNVKKNDKIELAITALTSEGSGLGRYDGMAVFVRGTVPGDRILAHIIKVSKNYAIGIIDTLLEASPDRMESDCSVSSKCGGCAFRTVAYSAELAFKQSRVDDAFARIGHLELKTEKIIGAAQTAHYRNKAQYPVRIENGVLQAGFYAYKSHRVVPCADCLLQCPEFKNGLDAFAVWVKENNITAYDEKTGTGLLRHIYFRKGVGTGEVLACAVIHGDTLPNSARLCALLRERMPALVGVVCNINKENTNVILGTQTKTLWGRAEIKDTLLGKTFTIAPVAFYQVNHDQCEKLYALAGEYAGLTGEETLLDLYCGAGTIGICLSNQCRQLIGVEIVPQAVENAKQNALQNGVTNARFLCADAPKAAQQLLAEGIQPDVVIVDPPRKGCGSSVFDAIEKMGAKRIVYVSCDPATLARDLAVLEEKGYRAVKATAVDMFPRTPHVETVTLLVKEKS